MRDASRPPEVVADEARSTSHGDAIIATAWRGGELLATEVELPVSAVSFNWDATRWVQGQATVQFADPDGTLWPRSITDALAAGGSRLRLAFRYGATGTTIDLGVWRIRDTVPHQQWQFRDIAGRRSWIPAAGWVAVEADEDPLSTLDLERIDIGERQVGGDVWNLWPNPAFRAAGPLMLAAAPVAGTQASRLVEGAAPGGGNAINIWSRHHRPTPAINLPILPGRIYRSEITAKLCQIRMEPGFYDHGTGNASSWGDPDFRAMRSVDRFPLPDGDIEFRLFRQVTISNAEFPFAVIDLFCYDENDRYLTVLRTEVAGSNGQTVEGIGRVLTRANIPAAARFYRLAGTYLNHSTSFFAFDINGVRYLPGGRPVEMMISTWAGEAFDWGRGFWHQVRDLGDGWARYRQDRFIPAGTTQIRPDLLLVDNFDDNLSAPRNQQTSWLIADYSIALLNEAAPMLTQELARLADDMPIKISVPGGLPNMVLPRDLEYDEDRLAVIQGLLDRVDATFRATSLGELEVIPASGTPTGWVIEPGEEGTLVDVTQTVSDQQLVNGVTSWVQHGEGNPPLVGRARITEGPLEWGGPFGKVLAFRGANLARTQTAVDLDAQTTLNRLSESGDIFLQLETVLNPIIQLHDRVILFEPEFPDLRKIEGRVVAISWGGADGVMGKSMALTLAVDHREFERGQPQDVVLRGNKNIATNTD